MQQQLRHGSKTGNNDHSRTELCFLRNQVPEQTEHKCRTEKNAEHCDAHTQSTGYRSAGSQGGCRTEKQQ